MQYEKAPFLNMAVVTGRLLNDPQVHDNNRVTVFFHINGYFDKTTKREKNYVHIGVTCFGKAAAFLAKRSKGDILTFTGRMGGYEQDVGGKKVWRHEICADKVCLYGSVKGFDEVDDAEPTADNNPTPPEQKAQGEAEEYDDEGAPF